MDKADKVVLNAEKIRANLIAPRGMLPINIDSNIELLRNLDNDDDFFHVSCHVDPALKEKIERGDFIDLDKLLPKDKAAGGYSMSEEHQGIQLFTKNGQTFLAPAASEKKISNLKMWDQAFWVYATIYMRANPQRSSEVWQYVHIIHTAAGTYSWSNVSFYDFMFRKLMATKPWHSWVKMYNQGWNFALKDPAMKVGNIPGGNSAQNSGSGQSQQGKTSWKDNCCWCYNKNRCTREAGTCRYDHHCTYCGGWNHSFTNCKKRHSSHNGGDKQKSPTGRG